VNGSGARPRRAGLSFRLEKTRMSLSLEIETPRLVLRQWLAADRKPFAAMNADARVTRYLLPLTAPESDALADRLAAGIEATASVVPAVSLLDAEYLLAVTTAEIRWVDSVLAELRAGRLTWTQEGLRAVTESEAGGLPTR